MRKGTLYAKKLHQAYGKFKRKGGPEDIPEPTPPVDQLILAVLSEETQVSRARKALDQISDDMVDYNELRVSTPAEISRSIGKHIPRSVQRAKALIRLLNAIYQQEYTVSLDALMGKGVREAKGYLESLDGITPYVTASVMLWSLGGHAIPVNEPALAFLRKQGLVDPDADGAEVQAFLERNISAADAKAFCLDLEAFIASRPASANGEDKPRPSGAKKKSSTKRKSSTRKKTKSKTARRTAS